MWLLLLLGFFQLGLSPQHKTVDQSKKQAKHYIQQIEAGQYLNQNLWALTVLSTENAQIKRFVENKVSQRENKSPLSLFENIENGTEQQLQKVVFATGSADLLIALLLTDIPNKKSLYSKFVAKFSFPAASKIDYPAICEAIIHKQEIEPNQLPTDTFHLPHFFLLSNKDRVQFFPDKYLSTLVKNWEQNIQFSNSSSLEFPIISYLQAAYKINRYDAINSLYDSLFANRFFPNSSLKLRIYRYLDYSMYRLGHFDKNLTIVRNILFPLSHYLKDEQAELSITKLFGVYLYSIGKLNQAKNIYTQVLEKANTKNIPINRSSLYNNLGITHLKLGEYNKYLELQFKALQRAQEEKNYDHQLDIYNNLFIYHKRIRDKENALYYLNEARQLAQKEDDSEDLGIIYTSLGSTFRKFNNDYEKAHSYFQRAKNYLDPQSGTQYLIELLNEQAETFEQQQKFEQALAKHDRILELSPNPDSPTHIDALVNKALVNLKGGNIAAAKQLIDTFKSFDLNKLDFDQVVKANTVQACFLNKTDQPEKALKILSPTIDQIVKRAKSSTDLQSGFWHVVDEYLEAFDLTVSIHIQNDRPQKAIALLDQLKTINDASIYQNPLVKASLLNEAELTHYKNITKKLDEKRKQFLTTSGDQKLAVRQQLNELELQKRKLDRKISTQTDNKSVSVASIQNRLSARQLVLHITELKDQYYIARISRTDVSIDIIPIDQEIRNLFTTSTQQIANNATNLDSLYAISELLRIQKIPDRINEVTVIPDSYLYQLPIDVLPLKKPVHHYSYGATTYFIEKYRTHYLTSLDDFYTQRKRTHTSNYQWNYTGYGASSFKGYQNKNLVPLPYASKEVKLIKDKLSHLTKLQTYTDASSRKNTFAQTAPQSRILHLATHSEVSERDPLFSTIYLGSESENQDNSFNNQLFAYELFELNLNNEMIMLNSCKSGSGSYIQGTGIMGFSRALQYAGANSLVLNTWSVNDMLASDFAVYFYDQLNKGQSKAEALRNTKKYFLESKNASPHFWGSYMLIGQTDPIVHPNRKLNLAVAGSFVLYFLIFVILSYLKERKILFQ